jgi:hypothetical protein
LANSKTQNAFLSPVLAMFHHEYPLVMKPVMHHGVYYPNKLGEILYLLIFCFLLCLSWLLHCRVQKIWRDLWITLYIGIHERK